jgi:hypothetical protein
VKRKISILISAVLILGFINPAIGANPKAGSSCSKVGKKQVYAGKTFTCVKKGKKNLWSKGVRVVAAPKPVATPTPTSEPVPVSVPVPTPSPTVTPESTPTPLPAPTPTPTPTEQEITFPEKLWSRAANGTFPIQKDTFEIPNILPTSWQDIYERRIGIAYSAWSQVSKNISSSASKVGSVEVFVGPNTIVTYPYYRQNMEYVSRAFPTARNVTKLKLFIFNFRDSKWADETFKRVYAFETQAFKDRHANAVAAICPETREVCFAQAFIDSNSEGVIMYGMTDKGSKEQLNQTFSEYARDSLGYVIGHEYMHTIQRVILGNRWYQRDYTPPSWFNEGSAVFIENAAPNLNSFDAYMRFRAVDSKLLYADCPYAFCLKLDEKLVVDYLSMSHYSKNWDNFPYAMKYEMSARIMEILVAVKGPDSLINLIETMATEKKFEQAFEIVYGINYETAKPIIARIIVDQFNNEK